MRSFTAHGAQLAVVAVRPLYTPPPASSYNHLAFGHNKMNIDVAPQRSGASANHAAPPSSAAEGDEYDPLFDEPVAEGEPDPQIAFPQPDQKPPGPPLPALAMPGSESAPTFWPGSQAFTSGNSAPRSILTPKNMPPVLDPHAYVMYSSDLLLTASIDGQVILWDRRVNSTGRGVGRLWLNEKTPPWCMSVGFLLHVPVLPSMLILVRVAGVLVR